MEFLISLLFTTTLNVWPNDTVLGHDFFKAYESCKKTKKMIYLPKAKKKELEELTNIKNLPGVIKSYQIKCDNKKNKNIFLVSDLIRTHYQKAFVETEDGKINKVEVVHFSEPNRYKAPKGFISKLLNKSKFMDVDGLTGATLTRSSLIRMSKLSVELDQIQ